MGADPKLNKKMFSLGQLRQEDAVIVLFTLQLNNICIGSAGTIEGNLK